jgi:diguanylate cyclase
MAKTNPFSAGRLTQAPAVAGAPAAGEMALDTLASVLRSMAEFALAQEGRDLAEFRQEAEGWARHVAVAGPVPGANGEVAASGGGRRDWQGVREFVREYCRSSASHVTSVTGDLRDVIWVFIRNFSRAFAVEEEADERVREHVARLERLAEESDVGELKREVLCTVGVLTRALGERRERQRAQMAALGDTVRSLGDELESARREGEVDPLTRVFNRKALDAYLGRTLEIFEAFRRPATLLIVDVDEFKSINDTYGHAAGDQVLCEVANAIVRVFLRKNDFVARFGGDEFVVALRETALEDAVRLAERLVAGVRALCVPAGGRNVRVRVSVGAAGIAASDDVKSWFERADRGLYTAKSSGRDRVGVGE